MEGIGNKNTKADLPSSNQHWAHSVCTIQSLSDALSNPSITAIETDILMGTDKTDVTDDKVVPIMAHPPVTSSDLSTKRFFNMVTTESYDDINSNPSKRILRKHIKLDFKELDVVGPTLNHFVDINNGIDAQLGMVDKTIFLNADILPGPGCRNKPIIVESQQFIQTCFDSLNGQNLFQFAFSLGWRVDCRSFFPYTDNDIHAMKQLIVDHDLISRSQGVVLAVNARVLAKNCKPFYSILHEMPKLQLLVWTGASGEPPISSLRIRKIKHYFNSIGVMDRIGFDCKVEQSLLKGLFYDTAVQIVGIVWNLMGILYRLFIKCRSFTQYAPRKEHSN